MAFLVLPGGLTVSVALDGGEVDPTEIGDRGRAVDGTMRAAILATKNSWSVKTPPMMPADAATLRAALLANPKGTASGDWLGGATTVWPKLGKQTLVATPGGFRVVTNLTLDEG